MSLVNCTRWKLQSMDRASAWPSVVLPTPGTPSINKCPRAKIETRARRTTSSLPRIILRSEDSSWVAWWRAPVPVCVAIKSRFYYGFGGTGRGTDYQRTFLSIQHSAFSLIQTVVSSRAEQMDCEAVHLRSRG